MVVLRSISTSINYILPWVAFFCTDGNIVFNTKLSLLPEKSLKLGLDARIETLDIYGYEVDLEKPIDVEDYYRAGKDIVNPRQFLPNDNFITVKHNGIIVPESDNYFEYLRTRFNCFTYFPDQQVENIFNCKISGFGVALPTLASLESNFLAEIDFHKGGTIFVDNENLYFPTVDKWMNIIDHRKLFKVLSLGTVKFIIERDLSLQEEVEERRKQKDHKD